MLTPNLQPFEQWPCLCDPIPNRMSFVNRKYMDLCVLYIAHCQRDAVYATCLSIVRSIT